MLCEFSPFLAPRITREFCPFFPRQNACPNHSLCQWISVKLRLEIRFLFVLSLTCLYNDLPYLAYILLGRFYEYSAHGMCVRQRRSIKLAKKCRSNACECMECNLKIYDFSLNLKCFYHMCNFRCHIILTWDHCWFSIRSYAWRGKLD